MKNKEVRLLAKEIYRTFQSKECLLIDHFVGNSDLLSKSIGIITNTESFIESFAYEYSRDFETLIDLIKKEIESHRPSNRIEIRQEIDGIYISLSILGKEVNIDCEVEYYQLFKEMECLEKMKKGLLYEDFCTFFLEDIGLEAEKTKASNDKGIDIIAKYKTNLTEEKSALVFNDYVYLIGQAKFLSGKVDTPIIRRLVGDSLFIRFNQLEYIELAHNAIHLIVFSHNGFTDEATAFCTSNKIMRIETSQMITILASKKEPLSNKTLSLLRGTIVENGGTT